MNTNKIKKILNRKTYFWILSLLVITAVVFISFAKIKQNISLNYLEEQISHFKSDFSGSSSLIIYKPGFLKFEFAYNQDEKIAAASLIKLPILAAALKAVYEDRIELDQKVQITSKDITGGSGIFKKIEMPFSLTFKELLSFMIIISDNTATNKVIDILGIDYINKSFLDFNLKDTVLKRKMMDFSSRSKGIENYTSSRDVVRILKKIYYEQLINQQFSQFARDLLSRQQYNDRIAYFLPKEVEVAHKTGLERGVVHDAGIVYGKKKDFIICVLTKDVRNYSKAKEFIANISQLSYNFLN
ncbi:MAG: class A beta-lactamase-related serine hydrolase [Candidatus Omnitrophica bacterium]|nr:class A beta-lactamase-related serine hydrolase [Candidatus Omnitrophota bacterium]MCF7887871.1 class A beta-lactamase-related serine hydrolase [Candidatus Omnitrophota bacterium]